MALRGTVTPHFALLRNVSSLAGGMMVNSVLGFAYWWTAARFFSLETAGYTAAAVSIMSLIGLLAQLGLGTVLIGNALSDEKKQVGLISAAIIVSSAMAILLGFLFLAAAWVASLDLGRITGSTAGAFCFVLGCGATCLVAMLDSAFIGLLRSSIAVSQEIALSAGKLGLLVLFAVQYGAAVDEEVVFATWIIAQAVSACVFAVLLRRLTREYAPVPDFAAVRALMPVSLAHYLLDLVIQTPVIVMPFLVTVLLSPAVNAAFNAAWMMVRITFLLPAALSTMLFAIGRAKRNAFASRLRFSILLLTVGGAGVIVCFAFFADFILNIFNRQYPAIAANSLRLFGASFLAVAVSSLYLAIQRLNGRMIRAVYVFASGGLAELLFAAIGAHLFGLSGLSFGWTVAVTLQAIYMAKLVLREADLFNAKRAQLINKVNIPWRNSPAV